MSELDDDIRRYRDGSMSGAERNALEKKALNDPFLADALEGAETVSAAELSMDVAELSGKIQVVRKSPFTPMRIAAGILLVITIGSLLFYFQPKDSGKKFLAKNKTSAGPDSVSGIVPKDSSGSMMAMAEATKDKGDTKSVAPQKGDGIASKKVTKPTAPATTLDAEANTTSEPATKTITESATQEAEKAEEIATRAKEELSAQQDRKAEITQAAPLARSQPEQKTDDARDKRAAGLKAVNEGTRASRAVSDARTIGGKVTAAEDGAPLPGVNVIVRGTSVGTVTDSHGNYSIAVNSSDARLNYSFIGMETKEVDPGQATTLNIQLKEDASMLSEIVVTGQSDQPFASDDLKKPVVRLAAPVGGMRAYNKYLEGNLKYPAEALEKKIKGKVTITFTVTTTGNLTDFSVVRGLGYGCEEEVVRLVKEGPTWSPSLEDDVPVESEVRVKLKFDPEKANR